MPDPKVAVDVAAKAAEADAAKKAAQDAVDVAAKAAEADAAKKAAQDAADAKAAAEAAEADAAKKAAQDAADAKAAAEAAEADAAKKAAETGTAPQPRGIKNTIERAGVIARGYFAAYGQFDVTLDVNTVTVAGYQVRPSSLKEGVVKGPTPAGLEPGTKVLLVIADASIAVIVS